jgi:hypothetical protein
MIIKPYSLRSLRKTFATSAVNGFGLFQQPRSQSLFQEKIFCRSIREVSASHSIQELGKMLPDSLIRCHKSYIVALSGITSIERDRIKIGNKYIPIGDSYREEFYRHI